jgi:hypothetical protein
LLHDVFQYFQQPELTDYINEARLRVCGDTKCNRQLLTSFVLTAGVEIYPIATINTNYSITAIDVMGIQLYFGTQRYPLNYYAWTEFNARYRPWQAYQQRPTAFSWQGGTNIFIGNTPDQAYVTDWDIATYPGDLTTLAQVDTIPLPFQSAIKYYAASLAMNRKQEFGEVALLEKKYIMESNRNVRAFQTRIIQDPYYR